MKSLFAKLALAAIIATVAAPAFAANCTPSGDHPNHQSSLSSTTEGGVVCPVTR